MGRLDQRHPSYWIADTRATDYPRVPDGVSVDVAVIGAGITGLTTAYLLAVAGSHVAVIEYDRVASGTTGYTTAKVTSQHRLRYADLIERNGFERARMYADAQQAALEWIAATVSDRAIACDFRRMPAFVYAEQEETLPAVRAELAAAESLGLPAAWSDDTPLPFRVAGALRFDDQAIFHPRKYCLALADAIISLGGRIFERTRAVNVEDGSPCRVETEEGEVRARHVVIATGLPFPAEGAFYARMQPSRSYAIAAAGGPVLDGMFISAESPTRSIRPHESGDERVLVVSGEEHHVGKEPDTDARYRALEDFARERLGLDGVHHRWSAQDYLPADGIPYVGLMTEDTPHVYVATGFQKWGMTNGTAAAMMIADAIAGTENPWARAFDSTRIRPAQSARTVASMGVQTAKGTIGDRIATLGADPIEELGPGDARIVRLEGEKVAAFRDEQGVVHAVDAACTHMGCLVRWNTAERTWDCPCHGSRFDIAGAVIEGPATRDLERKKV